MIKVVAINGSARVEKGHTAKFLAPVLDGMRKAGAEVELLYSRKLKITPCIGDFQCWFEKVGECIYSDDMQMVIDKLKEADIFVLATPVYLPLPGALQNLLNRLMPLVEPLLEFRDGRTRATLHKNVKFSKIVLVSVGGWWEVENMATVKRIAKELAEDISVEFLGALLRPHAFLLKEYPKKAKEVLEATKAAGYQLVKNGKIDEPLFQIISQPLVSEEALRNRYNESYLRTKQR